jgi:glycosyltransferase involved in cell wall biosynthesis
MLVSVLMPTFNVAAYVGEAIKSILEQTWRDLELLVQDDGSTDGTLAVTREMAQSDARVRVLEPFAVNRGVVAARNALVQSAKGEFIAWMDSDDISKPDRIERQIKFLNAKPEFGAVGTAIQRIDRNGVPLRVETFSGDPQRQAQHPFLACPSIVARRAAVEDAGPFREPFFVGSEDRDWLLKMADRHKITNISDVLYVYREHTGLFTRNRSAIARLGVLSRYAARMRRRGEPDPIDALVPDKELHYLRDEVFVEHPSLTKADKLWALAKTLPGHPPLVSVLIPYFDEDAYFFEKYLIHLSRQLFRNFEVIVHDDGSRTPVSEARIRQLLPEIAIKLTRSSEHQGAAHSRKELLRQARGSILMWHNEDLGSGWIRPEADYPLSQRRSISVQDFVANRI